MARSRRTAVENAAAKPIGQTVVDMPLWKGLPPGYRKTSRRERLAPGGDPRLRRRHVSGVTIPTLSIFPATGSRRTRMAVIVCPGGGYSVLSIDVEGWDVSRWLNQLGITAAVLKYRLRPFPEGAKVPPPLLDIQRAIRTMRSRADEYGFDPWRVGVIGFSAGGHLAASAATTYDSGNPRSHDPIERQSSRPDFVMPIYPYIDEAIAGKLNYETPPAFIAQSADDFIGDSSVRYFAAARKADARVELHFFERAGHGYGLGVDGGPVTEWPHLCERWLLEVIEPSAAYAPPPRLRRVPKETGVHKRINCGARRQWQDRAGHIWEPDEPYRTDGGRADRGPVAVAGTGLPELYRTERYDLSALRVPVANGRYTVRLHFCETFEGVTRPGQRVFSVALNGRTVLPKCDPFAAAGRRRQCAVVREFGVTVADGTLEIAFRRVGASGPEINAVEIHGR